MTKLTRNIIAILTVTAGMTLLTASSYAQTSWRSVTDGTGITWARVKFVNNSAADSHWTVWNGRAAVTSTDTSAVIDQEQNWDGTVAAGATAYVWIYGVLDGDVNIANTDGGASTYYPGNNTPVGGGDSDLVITIAADGTVSTSFEAASYGVPSHTGSFDLHIDPGS